ncbi:hypothetical protein NM688_g3213 [Phlebia brevispora]|uniref:Uncharacterized protein n=1 Tax=Phlebia brevispora TaxID=194682 RepID=A0ACC1T6L4_9APHY|nr:hypothetical protein NM688_g3213 [Phlebia brevispora]
MAAGLGDSGHGWKSLATMFANDPALRHTKWILPHAPPIPVTINGGVVMPAWYDIVATTSGWQIDEDGILRSSGLVAELIQREIDSGIPPSRIVLGGFSQGGTLSLFTGLTTQFKLGGIIILSGRLALKSKTRDMISENARMIPIFWGHGEQDPMIKISEARESIEFLQHDLSLHVSTREDVTGLEFHSYEGLTHSAGEAEIQDLRAWLLRIFSALCTEAAVMMWIRQVLELPSVTGIQRVPRFQYTTLHISSCREVLCSRRGNIRQRPRPQAPATYASNFSAFQSAPSSTLHWIHNAAQGDCLVFQIVNIREPILMAYKGSMGSSQYARIPSVRTYYTINMPRSQLLLRQPFTALYLSYFYFVLLSVKIPFWVLTSLPRSWRPRPSWTIFRTVSLRVMEARMEAMATTSTYNMMRVDPQRFAKSADKVGLVWVEPIPELIVGDVKEYAIKNGVSSTRVAGYWYGSRSAPSPDEKIIYALHGGAFVFADASPVSYLENVRLCKEMLKYNQEFTKAFQIEYRLSQGPPLPHENPFPAALIDVVAGYHHLVKVMGYKPSNILVMGESAGGGLVINLVRYLITYIPSLPPPAAILLMSPAVDCSSTHFIPTSSLMTNLRSDFIGPLFDGYSVRALLGALPPSECDTNPWLSPVSKHLQNPGGWFKDFPPTFLIFGEAEVFRDPNRTLAKHMTADMGERLTYLEVPDATHIFMSFTWHEPERAEGLRQVAKWLSVTM